MTISELNDLVRFTLGGLGVGVISDEDLNRIIQNVIDAGIASNDCQEKFYSVKQTLIFLDTKSAAGSAGTGASGAIKSIEEESGKRKIKKTWDTSGEAGKAASWKDVLESFLENPSSYILCEPFPEVSSGATGSVIIGGVSHKEADRVNSDPDTRNGYNENPRDTLNRYPSYRRTTRNPFGYN